MPCSENAIEYNYYRNHTRGLKGQTRNLNRDEANRRCLCIGMISQRVNGLDKIPFRY